MLVRVLVREWIFSDFVQYHHFDVNKSTRVECDASKQCLGATVEKLHAEGWKPVSYALTSLEKAELKFCKNESELLAVV